MKLHAALFTMLAFTTPMAYANLFANGNNIQTTVTLTAGTTDDLSFAVQPNVVGVSNLLVTLDGFNTSIASATNPAAVLNFFNSSPSSGNRIWALGAVSLEARSVPLPAAVWTFMSGFAGCRQM